MGEISGRNRGLCCARLGLQGGESTLLAPRAELRKAGNAWPASQGLPLGSDFPPSWGLRSAEPGLGLKAAVPLQRPPHSFLVNMKLEAVDRRNPALIRVASVEDVEDHRIKVALGPSGRG